MLSRLPTTEPLAGELQRKIDGFEEIFAPPVLRETEARDRARAERRAAKAEVERLQVLLRELREPQGKTLDGRFVDGPRVSELRRAIHAAETRLQTAVQAYRLATEAEADAFRGFHDVVLSNGAVTLPVLRELVDAWVTSVEKPKKSAS